MSAIIEPATADDVVAIAALDAAAFPDRPWSAELWATEIASGRSRVAVVRNGGQVVGVIALSRADEAAEVADLDRVVVRPDLRGQGMGGALVDDGLAWAVGCGVRRVLLEVEHANAAARRLYANRGFVEIGVRRGYYGPGRDAVVMEASATPAPSGDLWWAGQPPVAAEIPRTSKREGDSDE